MVAKKDQARCRACETVFPLDQVEVEEGDEVETEVAISGA